MIRLFWAHIVMIAVGLAAAGPLPIQAQNRPYTLDQITLLIEGGVSTARILELSRARCLAFESKDFERELTAGGANAALVRGLRSVCVRPARAPETGAGAATRSSRSPVPAANCGNNNTFQCATLLPSRATDSNEFSRGNKYYKFLIDRPLRVVVTLNPMPNSRGVTATVYDSGYNRIAGKRFGAGMPGDLQVSLQGAGLYYLELDVSPCCSGAPPTYSVTVAY